MLHFWVNDEFLCTSHRTGCAHLHALRPSEHSVLSLSGLGQGASPCWRPATTYEEGSTRRRSGEGHQGSHALCIIAAFRFPPVPMLGHRHGPCRLSPGLFGVTTCRRDPPLRIPRICGRLGSRGPAVLGSFRNQCPWYALLRSCLACPPPRPRQRGGWSITGVCASVLRASRVLKAFANASLLGE